MIRRMIWRVGVLLCLWAALLTAGAQAAEGTCGGEEDGSNLTWVLDAAGTLTIQGTGRMGDWDNRWSTPWAEVSGNIRAADLRPGVTSVGAAAFHNCDSLEAVTLPDGVVSIGSGAFADCNALTSVTLPEGVVTLGQWAFIGCDHLEEITIPESVASIGQSAFAGCDALTDVFYGGGPMDWYAMAMESGNNSLTSAKIHYGKSYPVDLTGTAPRLSGDSVTVTAILNSTDGLRLGLLIAASYAGDQMLDCKCLASVPVPQGVEVRRTFRLGCAGADASRLSVRLFFLDEANITPLSAAPELRADA